MRIVGSTLLGMGFATISAIAFGQPGPEAVPAPTTPLAFPTSDVPPPPPPPGSPSLQPEPPPPVSPLLLVQRPVAAALGSGIVAGWNDGFYLADTGGSFRFFPGALLQSDFLSFFGSGVADVPSTSGGVGLKPRVLLRRARLSFAGEFLKRWSFLVSGELGGDAVSNTDGKAELSAALPGSQPTAATARYAPVESVASSANALDVWISYRVAPWLNCMVGQFAVPFSMENRTNDATLAWMERNVAIRSFVVPNNRDIGAMLWGAIGDGMLVYELGMFGGEGQNRPSVDSRFDFIGRIYARPFAKSKSPLAKSAQIGLSGRHGDRDPKAVGYAYPALTTGQGFVLWKPSYTDSLGRLTHILPSGSQDALGGELRVRTDRVALQSELYYLHNNTREAIDGFQLTNTERFGRFQGIGWYAQLSAWPLGDAFVSPEPGVNRPKTLDLANTRKSRPLRGIEVLAIAAGINANYQGAARLSSPADAKTPASNVTVYQLGLGAQYWHTKFVRFAVNYNAYHTPGSAQSSDNQAVVPDNLLKDSAGKTRTGNLLHELGARLSLSF